MWIEINELLFKDETKNTTDMITLKSYINFNDVFKITVTDEGLYLINFDNGTVAITNTPLESYLKLPKK
jgi:hypothetical protein